MTELCAFHPVLHGDLRNAIRLVIGHGRSPFLPHSVLKSPNALLMFLSQLQLQLQLQLPILYRAARART